MKIIKFFSHDKYLNLGQPIPARKTIPQWYKNAENVFMDPLDPENKEHPGLKKCIPFLDTMMSGYFLTFPVNVYINEQKEESDLSHLFQTENDLSIRWDGPPSFANLINERPSMSGSTMPRPAGHYPNHLVFGGTWSVKTPRGWSILMTQPLNRYDLPFTTSSGIVDSDHFTSPGNVPFFIKKGFSGVIPAGTPFLQLIPIKRANWTMSLNDKMLRDRHIKESLSIRQPETSYKKSSWVRKKYE